jgi:hypothetical protein
MLIFISFVPPIFTGAATMKEVFTKIFDHASPEGVNNKFYARLPDGIEREAA